MRLVCHEPMNWKLTLDLHIAAESNRSHLAKPNLPSVMEHFIAQMILIICKIRTPANLTRFIKNKPGNNNNQLLRDFHFNKEFPCKNTISYNTS